MYLLFQGSFGQQGGLREIAMVLDSWEMSWIGELVDLLILLRLCIWSTAAFTRTHHVIIVRFDLDRCAGYGVSLTEHFLSLAQDREIISIGLWKKRVNDTGHQRGRLPMAM